MVRSRVATRETSACKVLRSTYVELHHDEQGASFNADRDVGVKMSGFGIEQITPLTPTRCVPVPRCLVLWKKRVQLRWVSDPEAARR